MFKNTLSKNSRVLYHVWVLNFNRPEAVARARELGLL